MNDTHKMIKQVEEFMNANIEYKNKYFCTTFVIFGLIYFFTEMVSNAHRSTKQEPVNIREVVRRQPKLLVAISSCKPATKL